MNRIALKYAFMMLAGFAGLFIIVHLLGMSDHYYLRVLNGVVHITALYLLIREYRKLAPELADNYISGVAIGMYSSVLAVALFTFGMFIFLVAKVPFFEKLQAQAPIPEYFTPLSASMFIFVEGVVVSLIGSYIVTRVVDARLEAKRKLTH